MCSNASFRNSSRCPVSRRQPFAPSAISGGGWDGNLFVEGYTHAPGEDDNSHLNRWPAILPDARTPVLQGREFDQRDKRLPQVAVVNETFARYYFKGQSPLGKWIFNDPTRLISAW